MHHPAPRPLSAQIPQPYALQQPGLGLRQDRRRAVPPQLGLPAQDHNVAGIADFRVRGQPTSLENLFARDFGGTLLTATSGGSQDPQSKKNYDTVRYALRMLAHINACARWLAFGTCRNPNCKKLHGNWPIDANGEDINSKYRDLARVAGVPQDWQPTERMRQ
jgi:hypothetical protein